MKTKLISSVAIAALLTTGAIAGDMNKNETVEAPKPVERSPRSTDTEKADSTINFDANKFASDAVDATKEVASDLKDAAKDTAETVEKTASDAVEQIEKTITANENIDTNPQSTSSDGFVLANDSQISASELLGKNVYNGSGENAEAIGDVNDVIMNASGQTEAIVIGVGGFIGLGEKRVAVEYDRVAWTNIDGEKTIMIDATKEELKNAPQFDVASTTSY